MRFKRFLLEATKEFNYVKLISDKVSKLLWHIQTNFSEYESREDFKKLKKIVIPFSKILKDVNILENGELKQLMKYNLELKYGKRGNSGFPYFMVNGRKAGGLYDLDVVLPFIDEETDKPFQGYDIIRHFSTNVLHELTHRIQDVQNKLTDSSGKYGAGIEGWLNKSVEREAIANQIYEQLQKRVNSTLNRISYRDEKKGIDEKKKKEIIKERNELASIFNSVESFIALFSFFEDEIEIDYPSLYSNLKSFEKHKPKEFEEYQREWYKELKKEFKNTLPEKIIRQR